MRQRVGGVRLWEVSPEAYGSAFSAANLMTSLFAAILLLSRPFNILFTLIGRIYLFNSYDMTTASVYLVLVQQRSYCCSATTCHDKSYLTLHAYAGQESSSRLDVLHKSLSLSSPFTAHRRAPPARQRHAHSTHREKLPLSSKRRTQIRKIC